MRITPIQCSAALILLILPLFPLLFASTLRRLFFDYILGSFEGGSLSIGLEFTYINIGFGAGSGLSPPLDIGDSRESILLLLLANIMQRNGRINQQYGTFNIQKSKSITLLIYLSVFSPRCLVYYSTRVCSVVHELSGLERGSSPAWTRLEPARVSWHPALGGSNRGRRAESSPLATRAGSDRGP